MSGKISIFHALMIQRYVHNCPLLTLLLLEAIVIPSPDVFFHLKECPVGKSSWPLCTPNICAFPVAKEWLHWQVSLGLGTGLTLLAFFFLPHLILGSTRQCGACVWVCSWPRGKRRGKSLQDKTYSSAALPWLYGRVCVSLGCRRGDLRMKMLYT